MDVQDALNRIGYSAGPVDGAPGRRTRQAIREFQRDIPDVPDGKLTPEQTQLLFSRAYPQPAQDTGAAYGTPPAGTPSQPGQVPADTSAAQPPQPGSGQHFQAEPVQPVATQPEPVAAAATSSAPASSDQPQVQVDEDGRQFIEVNGEKFFLETKE